MGKILLKILFGGPYQTEKDESNVPVGEYLELVQRIEQLGHDVTYTNPVDSALFHWYMGMSMEPRLPGRYDLIMCDTSLIERVQRGDPEFPSKFIDFLSEHDPPIIILADREVAVAMRPLVEKAGYKQIDKPFDIDEVVELVHSSLG